MISSRLISQLNKSYFHDAFIPQHQHAPAHTYVNDVLIWFPVKTLVDITEVIHLLWNVEGSGMDILVVSM